MKDILKWIFAKKHFVNLIFIDIFIILFSDLILIKQHSTINSIFCLLNWTVWSYLIGRYSIINYYENNLIINEILKINFTFITSTLTILVTDNLLFNINDNTKNLLINYLIASALSLIFVLTYKLINKKFYLKNKVNEWIFLGKEDKSKLINNLKNFSSKNYKIIYINIKEFKSTNLINKYTQGIIIEDSNIIDYEISKFLSNLKHQGIKIIDRLSWCENFLQFYPVDLLSFKDINSINFTILQSNFQIRLKRVSDVFLSFIILVLSFPFIFISCLIIKFYDRGPIFYSQIRNGYQGKSFRIWKLRTMVTNAEEKGIQWSSLNDKRITPFGKLLRASRLDEIPQLISVLKGEMSLIGPRPERPEIEKELQEKINYYNIRKSIRPGLSGWAQVNFPYGASIEDSKYKLGFEIFYIKNFSTVLDLIILFKTIKLVFQFAGSKPRN